MTRYNSGAHTHSVPVTNLTLLSESFECAIVPTHPVKDIKSKLISKGTSVLL